ncbi:5'/3'-nucleotidase SurE [Bacteroidota bacterium]
MEKNSDLLILVTNDDGIYAPGLQVLVNTMKPYGQIIVMAPEHSKSGMSHAITVKEPLRIRSLKKEGNVEVFSSNGTPVDCIKLATTVVLKNKKPDLIVSGINHGANSSASIFYSGTMGAAIEGCLSGIPSIGFSLANHSINADFSPVVPYVKRIVENTLKNQLPESVCLNVNFPSGKSDDIQGIKVCRQAKGYWKENFERRSDPANFDYYWLTGKFINFEPEAEDTDEWALRNNYVSIVPVPINLTSESGIEHIAKWSFIYEHQIQ